MLPPMTLCLTFDDGLKDHAEIVGPELARRGWRGAFNVPTRMMQDNPISIGQVRDLCLQGNESRRMSWGDVNMLLKMNHEVYPHTRDHRDLLALQNDGNWEELERQVAGAIDDFKLHTGLTPKFFCSPHNSMTDEIGEIIRRHGAEPYASPRPNFGWGNLPGSKNSIAAYLNWRYEHGCVHSDIMVHGIVRAHGGWRPFESREQFIAFLDEIAALERSGRVKVVPYSNAHRGCGRVWDVVTRGLSKIRRVLYWLRFRDRLTYEFPPRQDAFWLK